MTLDQIYAASFEESLDAPYEDWSSDQFEYLISEAQGRAERSAWTMYLWGDD